MKQIAFLAGFLASHGALAGEPLVLSIAARTPVAMVGDASGFGTAESRASGRVTEASARRQCDGFIDDDKAELDACTASWLKQFPNDLFASANCETGILRPVSGGSYRYAGAWTEGEEAGVTHRSKWRGGDGEVVGTATVDGGFSLAQQWSILCGINATPKVATVKPVSVTTTPRSAHEPTPAGVNSLGAWDHNGSEVTVDPDTGVIAYRVPKPSIRTVAGEGTVVFRGHLRSERRVQGVAYAFKDGCAPAPYQVAGSYSRDGGTLILRGLGPVRHGCEVVAYSERSPHAALKFVNLMSP